MNLAHDQHVDWPQVIRDLLALRMTLPAIASRIGATGPRVKSWLVIECQPRHDDGERLLAVWVKETRQPRERAPVVSRYAPRR